MEKILPMCFSFVITGVCRGCGVAICGGFAPCVLFIYTPVLTLSVVLAECEPGYGNQFLYPSYWVPTFQANPLTLWRGNSVVGTGSKIYHPTNWPRGQSKSPTALLAYHIQDPNKHIIISAVCAENQSQLCFSLFIEAAPIDRYYLQAAIWVIPTIMQS